MQLNYYEIGRNIRIKRHEEGLKQAQLAEKSGVTAQHISHIECSKTKLSLGVLVSIANALSTDVNILLGSNVRKTEIFALEAELSSVLKDATPDILKLCILLCRETAKFGEKFKSE